MKRIIIVSFLVLCVALALSLKLLFEARDDANRNRQNYNSAMSVAIHYLTKDSLNAANRKAQYVTIAQLREERANLTEEVKKMRLRLRNVSNITQIAQNSEYVVLMDTEFILIDTFISPSLKYEDEWITAKLHDDTLKVETRDSLTIVTHSRRRKFLFWEWNKYTGEVSVCNHNPHTRIMGVETINIVK